MLLFLLLSLISFSFGITNIGKGQAKAVAILDNTPVYMLDSGTDNIEAEKLNSKSYKIKVGNKDLFDFEVKNKITADNRILDCGIFTCDFIIEIKANQALKLDLNQIAGGWQYGNAKVEKIFFYENVSFYTYEPIMQERERCFETNQTNSSYCVKYHEKVGTTQNTNYKIIEQTDLSRLTIKQNERPKIVIRFSKIDPTKKVDIYPVIYGHSFRDWAWWDAAKYQNIINVTMLYGAPELQTTLNSYAAFVSIDTSDYTKTNTTGRVGIAFTLKEDNTTRLNTTYLRGGGTTNTIYLLSIPNQTNSTEIVAHSNNESTETVNYNVNSIYANAKLQSYWDGESYNDLAIGNNDFTNYSIVNANTSDGTRFGGGLNFSAGSYLNRTAANISGTSGTFSCHITKSAAWDGTLDSAFSAGSGVAVGDSIGFIRNAGNTGFIPYVGGAQTAPIIYTGTTTSSLSYFGVAVNGNVGTIAVNSTYNTSTLGGSLSLSSPDIFLASWPGWPSTVGSGYMIAKDCKYYSENKSNDWQLADYALLYNGSNNWVKVVANELNPMIYNETNGTEFYTDDNLIGWINITSINTGLWNVTYKWFNGSTEYSSKNITNLNANSSGISYNIANISSSLTKAGETWTLQTNASNGTEEINASNSSVTILNYKPVITNFDFTSNGSAFILGEVEGNITTEDIELDQTLTLYWNWFKNGANQTALAGSTTVTNGTPYNINAAQSPYTEGDNWSLRVWVNDGIDTTPYNDSENTTIQEYIQNILIGYTDPQADTVSYDNYLNVSLYGAATVSATLYFGGQNTTATSTNISNEYKFNVTAQPQPGPNTEIGNWYIKATLANGSTYSINYSYSVTVLEGGVFLCGGATNTTTLIIETYDEQTGEPVNSTILSQIEPYAGKIQSYETIGINQSLCLFPPDQEFMGGFFTTATATNYSSRSITTMITYSNTTQTINLYLLNDTLGAFYTFTVLDQFELPIQQAKILINRFLSSTNETETISELSTNPDGTGTAFLLTQVPYEITVSADGFENLSFTFTPAAVSDLTIQLTPSSVLNRTPIEYGRIWNNVSYSLEPNTYTQNETFNISYSVQDNSSSLDYWGMQIIYENGTNTTTVYNSNQTSASGGTLYYTASQNGSYIVTFWFKKSGYRIFSPTSLRYYLGKSTGIFAIGEQLSEGNTISGWAYYFVFLVLAMVAGGFLARSSYEGSAYASLVILWVAVVLWPTAPLSEAGFFTITSFHATLLTTLATLGGGAVFRGV